MVPLGELVIRFSRKPTTDMVGAFKRGQTCPSVAILAQVVVAASTFPLARSLPRELSCTMGKGIKGARKGESEKSLDARRTQ